MMALSLLVRSRPTSRLLHAHQSTSTPRLCPPGDTQGRLLGFQYSSTSSSERQLPDERLSATIATSSQAQVDTLAPENAISESSRDQIYKILEKLELGNRQAANTTKSMRESELEGPALSQQAQIQAPSDTRSLSLAVGESAGTDNYRIPIRRVELKLGTMLGRQVHVEPDKGVDLAAAIRNLQINCVVNRVRAQSFQQKFHVRRGQRRKDLRRDRWRRLFKFSFQKTVTKIQKMRAQGW